MTRSGSLLHKIVGIDAEALVMASGDVPYVVVRTRPSHVGSSALPGCVVESIVRELLPADLLSAFENLGLVEYDLPSPPDLESERFTVAAERHQRLLVVIRRRRSDESLAVPATDSLWPTG
jgi:hypothetical protein